jgi:beta-fructofuranosidase
MSVRHRLERLGMTLFLDDCWIWDFWLATDADEHHVFYLKAPKSIGDPEERHWNVSIGHAVSTDLHDWTVVDDVIAPSPVASWDDKSTWTGSVIEHGGRWVMLYPGTSPADEGHVQRVGMLTSEDLHRWERLPEPVLTADPEHHEILDLDMWHDQAWRDPWMYDDPTDGHVHVLVTARANHGHRYDRGVIGHARSRDLLTWEMLPSIATPPGFGQLEVPQLVKLDDRWYLLFASDLETQGEERRSTGADDASRTRGLMFRDSMPKDRGMLFVFETEEPLAFWMKNTRIPLDIFYFDKSLRLVSVAAGVPPCTTQRCPNYPSAGPAMFTLELNAGRARTLGAKPGDRLLLAPEIVSAHALDSR